DEARAPGADACRLFSQNSARLDSDPRRSPALRLVLLGAGGALALVPWNAAAADQHQPTAAPAAVSSQAVAAAEPQASSSIYVHGSWIDVCGLTATTECPLFDAAAAET